MMKSTFVSTREIQEHPLWNREKQQRRLLSFSLELTARCALNCRHCYINLPAADQQARAEELTLAEIDTISEQAVELGALWCLLTGGDPLLRSDFPDIYMMLKRKGLLVSVFTSAVLLNREHIDLFRQFPPRDIEVTVYGVTKETYEGITRSPGSHAHFMRGLDLLRKGGVKVRLKAMALRSNLHELDAIADFSRTYGKDYFRFDPILHLRFDGDQQRNREIRSERLSPEQITALDRDDSKRFTALQKKCSSWLDSSETGRESPGQHPPLFRCAIGNGSCNIGYNGIFRACSSLCAPGTTCDLRQTSLQEAWQTLIPKIRRIPARRPELLTTCSTCPYASFCTWCPAHAHLETGYLEGETPYFCAVTQARIEQLENEKNSTFQC